MATCVGMVARIGCAALTALKPAAGRCSKQRTSVFFPLRFSHGARSSLYEHVREGYSDKPELDMRAVCEDPDKVMANVENRKGDLRADDVRRIVSGSRCRPGRLMDEGMHGDSILCKKDTCPELTDGCSLLKRCL